MRDISMSSSGDLERGEREYGYRDHGWPYSGTNSPSPAIKDSVFNIPDGTEPCLSRFSMAAGEGNAMTERWQKDADGILIFTGLFSATVAALLAVTVMDLRSNSQDTSAFYVKQIYQILANSSSSQAPLPSILAEPPQFSPSVCALWVNLLWVLSLFISLTCAMFATLVHRWARRCVKFNHDLRFPNKGMRPYTSISYKVHVSWVIELLVTLIHISLFLFLVGLLVFLSGIGHTLFSVVASWMALSVTAYIYVTFLPIIWPNNPYYTPLSSIIFVVCTGIPLVVFKVLSSTVFRTSHRLRKLKGRYHKRFVERLKQTAEKTPLQRSLEIDVRVLISTLEAATEDGARAEFFEAIPGFFNSGRVGDIEDNLLEEFRSKFSPTLNSFVDQIFSSDSVTESDRISRLIACLNATGAVLGSDSISRILYDILNGRWQEPLQSIEMAHSLRQWSKSTGDEFAHYVRRIVTQVVTGAPERNERWIELVVDEFEIPREVLLDKIGHSDHSVLLALLLYMIRHANQSGSWTPWILSSLCQFDTGDTLPELQHDFCTLWNEIVHQAQRDGRDSTAVNILREIRHAYIQLHRGTVAAPIHFSARTYHFNDVLAEPQSYPRCTIARHRRSPVADQVTSTATPASISIRGAVTQIPSLPPSESPNSISQRAKGASIIQPVPSSANPTPRPSSRTLHHRHTFPSGSPSNPPMQIPIAQPVSSIASAHVPGCVLVHRNTLNRKQRHKTLSVPDMPDIATNSLRLTLSTTSSPFARHHVPFFDRDTAPRPIDQSSLVGYPPQRNEESTVVLPNILSDSPLSSIFPSVPSDDKMPSALYSSTLRLSHISLQAGSVVDVHDTRIATTQVSNISGHSGNYRPSSTNESALAVPGLDDVHQG